MADLFARITKRGLFDFLNIFKHGEKTKTTLIIPAYNEAERITHVLQEAKKVKEIDEILVVDDGSKDNTPKIAKKLGAKVISHHQNLGKGEAIRTGITHAKGNVLLFLDADLMDITALKIAAIIRPILKDKADFVKTSFGLERGRVTEFAIRPMMKVLYPGAEFGQPISGQFAGRKKFLKRIKIEPRWGIDISILLDAIEHGERVVEVDIGELKHKARTTEEKAEMSQEVLEVMLKKSGLICHKHKVIFFSDKIFKREGLMNSSKLFLENLKKKRITRVLFTTKDGNHSYKEYFEYVKKIESSDTSESLIKKAKQIAKKYGAELKETVLVANRLVFSQLAKKVDKAFCFESSPPTLKKNCTVISNIAEVLMVLE